MFLWLRKDYNQSEGELIVTFDPPEENEVDEWIMFSTRERHYNEIAKTLEKTAREHDKAGDYRSKNMALNLACELRKRSYAPTTVN